MKTKHTPGPWTIQPADTDHCWFDITGPKDVHARTFYGSKLPLINIEEAEANAKLIAAAPDLLTACELALSLLGEPSNEISGEDYRFIQSVIKKATE